MKPFLVVMLAPLFASSAFAQDWPEGDVFFGFSYLRANSATTILAYNSYGGVGTVGLNFTDRIGLEIEVGGYHSPYVDTFHNDTNTVTYMFGPRISYGRSKRIDPYFHGLVGGIHTATSIPVSLTPTPVSTPVSLRTAAQDNISIAIGGGVDIRLSRYVSFRPAQVDWVTTRLGVIGINGTGSNSFQNNFRYTVGFLFTIGPT